MGKAALILLAVLVVAVLAILAFNLGAYSIASQSVPTVTTCRGPNGTSCTTSPV